MSRHDVKDVEVVEVIRVQLKFGGWGYIAPLFVNILIHESRSPHVDMLTAPK